jgi:hypothetical protein
MFGKDVDARMANFRQPPSALPPAPPQLKKFVCISCSLIMLSLRLDILPVVSE